VSKATSAASALCCHLGVEAECLGGCRAGEEGGATNAFSNSGFEVRWVVLVTVASVFKIGFI